MFFNPPDDSPLATSVPCVVELSIGAGAEVRMYGPFPSLLDAQDWCARQVVSSFRIIPLRRTDKERTYGEWYDPQTHDINLVIDDFVSIETFRQWEENK